MDGLGPFFFLIVGYLFVLSHIFQYVSFQSKLMTREKLHYGKVAPQVSDALTDKHQNYGPLDFFNKRPLACLEPFLGKILEL